MATISDRSGWLYMYREISVRRYWSMERDRTTCGVDSHGRVPLSSLLCAIIRVLCSSLVTMYRCIHPRDLYVSSSGDSLDATSFVDLPTQSSVFASCSPRRSTMSSGGGENSRRSSVTIRIFWAVFYTRTFYIRFNHSVESRAIAAANFNVPPSDCFPIFRDIFRFRRIYIVSRLNNKSMFLDVYAIQVTTS